MRNVADHNGGAGGFSVSKSHPLTQGGITSPIGRITATAVQRSHGRVPRENFRRLGAHAFVFILSGHGRYRDENGVDVPISTGDLILVLPSLGHAYGPDLVDTWVERYVVFEGPVFALWERSGLLNHRQPVIHLGAVSEWNGRIDHLFGNSGRIGVLPVLEEVCRLQEFLAKVLLARDTVEPLSSEDRDWLSSAYALLCSESFASDDALALRSISESLSLSYDGFRKRFRRLADISPGRYRTLQRIKQACAMMQQATMTDQQIAEALGFYDASHFSKRFKQIMGRSPRAFRATLPMAGSRKE